MVGWTSVDVMYISGPGAIAQPGRALESHSRGRGFKSLWLHSRHRSSGVEHRIRNAAVVGSNPTGGSTTYGSHTFGAWLSPVERCVRDAEVPGSNPGAPIEVPSTNAGRPRSSSGAVVPPPTRAFAPRTPYPV